MPETNQQAKERVWTAFVGVKNFLRKEIWDSILDKTSVNPNDWTPILDAGTVAEEEEINVPARVVPVMKAALQTLERDLNDFLAVLREFVADRSAREESHWVAALNRKMDIARTHFEAALQQLKGAFDEGPDADSAHVSILFLAADPSDASRLRLGEEFREIHEKLQLARERDRFRLEVPQLALRAQDLSQALLDIRPQIVHFSGHGVATGALCFENRVGEAAPVEPAALAMLFSHFKQDVRCVVLNACFAAIQAQAIAQHIPFVIGMKKAIGDPAAIAFAIGFYQGLGGGQSVEEAYGLGCAQIALQGIPEHLTPVLMKRS